MKTIEKLDSERPLISRIGSSIDNLLVVEAARGFAAWTSQEGGSALDVRKAIDLPHIRRHSRKEISDKKP